jgi:hypothetical protein
MTASKPPPPMLPALGAPRPPLHSDAEIAMKRKREEWDNEGGQVRLDTDRSRPSLHRLRQFDPSLSGEWYRRAVPLALTVATVGVALAVALR